MKRIFDEIRAERRQARTRLVVLICVLMVLFTGALVLIAIGTAPWGPMPVRWHWQQSGYHDG